MDGDLVTFLGLAVTGNAVGFVDLEVGGKGEEGEGEDGWEEETHCSGCLCLRELGTKIRMEVIEEGIEVEKITGRKPYLIDMAVSSCGHVRLSCVSGMGIDELETSSEARIEMRWDLRLGSSKGISSGG